MTNLPQKMSVCTPLRRPLLIKVLLLTTSLVGQLQAIVKIWLQPESYSVRAALYIWQYDTRHRPSPSRLRLTHADLQRIGTLCGMGRRSHRDHVVTDHVYCHVPCESSGVWPTNHWPSEDLCIVKERHNKLKLAPYSLGRKGWVECR